MSGERLGFSIAIDYDKTVSLNNLKTTLKELSKNNKIDIGINFSKSTENIKKISESLENIKKININPFENIKFDKLNKLKDTLKELNTLAKKFDIGQNTLKQNTQLNKQNQIINQEINSFNELQDVVNKMYSNKGEIKLFANKTKDIDDFTVAIKKADGIVEQFKYKLNKDNKFELINTKIIDDNAKQEEKILQKTQSIRNKITQQELRDRNKIQQKINETINKRQKEQELLEKNQAKSINKNLENGWNSKNKDLLNDVSRINNEIYQTKQKIINLNGKQNVDEETQAYKKQLNTLYEIRRNKVIDLKSNGGFSKESELQIVKQIQEITRKSNKDEEVHQAKMLQTEELRLRKLGTKVGSFNKNLFGDEDYLKRQVLLLSEADAKIMQFGYNGDRSVAKVTVATKNANNEIKQEKILLDSLTGTIARNGEQIKANTSRMVSGIQKLGSSFRSMMSFMVSGALIYAPINAVRNHIDYLKQMDSEMTEIQMVAGMTKSQTDKLSDSLRQQGVELSKNSLLLAQSSKELFRQGLGADEVNKRLKTISKTASVLNTDVNDVTSMVTASVNAMGVKAEDFTDTITKLGATSATSGKNIGEAMKLAMSTSKMAGMSMKDLASIVTEIESVSQEESSSVGNSVKTLLAKFNQLNTRGLGTTLKTLKSVGIQVEDNNGQILDTMKILGNIAKVYDTLSENDKKMVSSSVGIRQINRANIIFQHWKDITKYQEIAGQSAGEVEKEYVKYTDSIAGHMDKLKSVAQQTFSDMLKSDDINTLTQAGIKVLTLVGHVGLLKTSVFALSSILLLTNKSFKGFLNKLTYADIKAKTFATSIKINGISLQELKIAFTEASASGGFFAGVTAMLKKGLDGITIASIGAKVAVIGFQIALTVGLSLAITEIVSAITKWKNKTDDLAQANQELLSSTKEHIQANNQMTQYLKEQGDEYDKLSQKERDNSGLTTEEQKKLFEIKEKIKDTFPELVQGYNKETGEIELQAKSTSELIELLKKKNKLENAKVINKGDDLLEEQREKYKDHVSKMEELQNKLNGVVVGVGNSKSKNSGMKEKAEEAQREFDSLIAKYDKEDTRVIEASKKKARLAQEYKNTLDAIGNEQEKWNEELGKNKGLVNAIYDNKELDSFEQKLANMSIDFDKFMVNGDLDTTNLQTEIQNFKEKLESDPNFKNIKLVATLENPKKEDLQKYFDSILSLAKTYKKSPIELTKMMPLKVDKEYLKKNAKLMITILQAEMKKASGQTKIDLGEMIKGLSPENLNQASNATQSLAEQQKTLADSYDDSVSAMKQYNKYLSEIKDKGHLSAESISEIISKHEELIPYLDAEGNVLYQKIQEAENNEKNNALNALGAKLEGNSTYCMNIFNKHKGMFIEISNAYGTDLENFKSISKTKETINGILTSNIGNQWKVQASAGIGAYKKGLQKFKGAMTQDFMSYKRGGASVEQQQALAQQMDDMKHLEGYIKGLEAMEDEIKNTKTKINNTSWGSLGGSSGSGKKKSGSGSKKSSSSKSSTRYAYEGKELNKYDTNIKTINDSLEISDKNISSISQEISDLQSLESKSTFSTILTQENKKLDEQHIKLEKLKSAQSQAKDMQKSIQQEFEKNWSWMKGKNVSKMSDTELDTLYNKYYGKKIDFGTSKSGQARKKAYEDGAKLFQDTRKNFENVKNLHDKSIQDELKIREEMTNTVKEYEDRVFAIQDNIMNKTDENISTIKNKIALLRDSDTDIKIKVELESDIQNELMVQNSQIKTSLEQIIKARENTIKAGFSSSIYDDRIKTLKGKLQSNSVEVKSYIENQLKEAEDSYNKVLAKAQKNAKEALEKTLNDSDTKIKGFTNSISEIQEQFNFAKFDDNLSRQIRLTGDEIDKGADKAKAIVEEYNNLSEATVTNEEDAEKLRNKLNSLRKELQDTNKNTLQYVRTLEQLKLTKITKEFDKLNEKVNRTVEGLQDNITKLKDGFNDEELNLDFTMPEGNVLNVDDIIQDPVKELKEVNIEKQELLDTEYGKELKKAKEHYDNLKKQTDEFYQQFLSSQQQFSDSINDKIKDQDQLEKEKLVEHGNEMDGLFNDNFDTYEDTVETRTKGIADIWHKTLEGVKKDLVELRKMEKESESIKKSIASNKSSSSHSSSHGKAEHHATGGSVQGNRQIVGEQGRELAILPNGQLMMVGNKGWTLENLPKDTQIVNNQETEKIMKQGGINDIPHYKDGTVHVDYSDEFESKYGNPNNPREKYNDISNRDFLKELNKEFEDIKDRQDEGVSTVKEQEKLLQDINNYSKKATDYSYDVMIESLQTLNEKAKDTKEDLIDELGEEKTVDGIKELQKKIDDQNKVIQTTERKLSSTIKSKLEADKVFRDKPLGDLKKSEDDINEKLKFNELEKESNDYLKNKIEFNEELLKNAKDYEYQLFISWSKTLDLRDAEKIGSEEWNILNKQLEDYNEKLEDAEYNIRQIDKTIKENVQNTVKETIELQKELEEKTLESQYNTKLKNIDDNTFSYTKEEWQKYHDKKLLDLENEHNKLKEKFQLDKDNIYLKDALIAKETELSDVKNETYQNEKKYQKETFEAIHKARIEAIDKEIEALGKNNQLEDEKEERLKHQNELIKLQQQLENTKNEKNIRTITKKADGTFAQEFVVDKNKIDDITKQIQDKQKDNAKWEQDLVDNKHKEELEKQKQYEEEMIKAKQDNYEKQKRDLDYWQNQEKEKIEYHYRDIDKLVKKQMKQLRTTYNNDWQLILDDLNKTINSAKTKLNELKTIQLQQQNIPINLDDMSKSQQQNLEDKINNDSEYQQLTEEYKDAFVNNNKNLQDEIEQKLHKLIEDKYKVRFNTGGNTGNWSGNQPKLAWLDQKEQILTSQQTKGWLKLVDNLPKLNNLVNLPKFNMPDYTKFIKFPNQQSQNPENHYHINKLEFPNVKSSDEIVRAVDNLPNKVRQRLAHHDK